MTKFISKSTQFPSQFGVLLLASALAVPAFGQAAQTGQPATSPATTDATPLSAPPPAQPSIAPQKEGFWGRVNPWARKKWVKRQTDPINDRLTELDGLNAKNSKDIADVDSRSQAGIHQAHSAADAAAQAAQAADAQAQQASTTAQGAGQHVNSLNSTVQGLDQYKQITEAEVKFRAGSPILSAEAKEDLDKLAAGVDGQHGFILDIESHSPLAGSAGIQSSERLAESVKRYLVTEHNIPVYRMHAVALGNAHSEGDEDSKPIRTSSVHIRLMENSLAAQASTPPQGADASTGVEKP